ncbi:MAG: toll/interleukin-1 receptor domain-containing protein, partial [Verrucomicrobiaceae bacterium]
MPLKVFLSHHSADKPEVEALAERLRREHGIEPWVDKWNLIPGQPWQEEIEEAMRECDCCAIFIGRGDSENGTLGPWQNAGMRALISRQIKERGAQFAVIPVLLPGAELARHGPLPAFLVSNTWVEFRHSLDDFGAFRRLLAGIRRERPGSGLPETGGRPHPPPPHICNLPTSIGSLFKGREDFLDRLRRGFQGSGAKASPTTATQTVHGLGGIGKTRAAIEYAHRHREEYSALLLVRADTAEALETNLASLASPRALDLPE